MTLFLGYSTLAINARTSAFIMVEILKRLCYIWYLYIIKKIYI